MSFLLLKKLLKTVFGFQVSLNFVFFSPLALPCLVERQKLEAGKTLQLSVSENWNEMKLAIWNMTNLCLWFLFFGGFFQIILAVKSQKHFVWGFFCIGSVFLTSSVNGHEAISSYCPGRQQEFWVQADEMNKAYVTKPFRTGNMSLHVLGSA